MGKRLKKIVLIATAFMLVGSSVAVANQTVNIDLNNFQDDGLGSIYPNYTIGGVADGDVITINVSNSTQGFLGYINDGVGNSLNISNGVDVNINNNTGQFFGEGDVSSVSYDNTIVGNYTITVTMGAGSVLSQNVVNEAGPADYTSDPNSAVGWIVLEWRPGLFNEENWKQISLVGSGPAAAPLVSNSLRLVAAPTLSQSGNTISCSPGTYKFLNGGSTEEAQNLGALAYTLVVDAKAVSRLGAGSYASLPSHFFPAITQSVSGSADMKGASWDVSALKNFDARCEIYAWQSGGNIQSSSAQISDAVKTAEIAAKAQAWEDQRAAANAANFTKEAREMRKRIAARSGN